MSGTRKHRQRLSEIPVLRVFSLGEQFNDACTNLAHDPCTDSWKTLLFKLESAHKEVRQYRPEIPVETDPNPVRHE